MNASTKTKFKLIAFEKMHEEYGLDERTLEKPNFDSKVY